MLAMCVDVLGFLFTQHYNDSIYFAIILCLLLYLSFIFVHGLFVLDTIRYDRRV